jgi:hypothetical protein
MGLTLKEKQAWTGEIASRYRQSDKKGKTGSLDEFVQATGYNRKYAVHILSHWGKETWLTADGKPVKLKAIPAGNRKGKAKRRKGGGRKPVYGPEVIASLRAVWAFFWYKCGQTEGPQILAPLMRQQMRYIAGCPAFHITPDIAEKLKTISPATIDQYLKKDRAALRLKGKSLTKPLYSLKNRIPIQTCYSGQERKKPDFWQIDTVHHCGQATQGQDATVPRSILPSFLVPPVLFCG